MEYRFGPFRLCADGRLIAHERVVSLTPLEEAFLRVLASAGGARVAKEEAARAWRRCEPSDASLARCVHTLRRKLREAAPGLRVIVTCYGRGYHMGIPVSAVAQHPRGLGSRERTGLEESTR